MSDVFKGFSLRELRMQRQQILRATAEAIGVQLREELPPIDVLRRMIEAKRPHVLSVLDAFIEADDVVIQVTEQADISQQEYAAAVTKRTMARNSLEAHAKAPAASD
jgi:hypothetical protein